MSVDAEIFAIFQHKVERILHFMRVTEVTHIIILHLKQRYLSRREISTTKV